jgi:hypothetical protein
MKNEYGLECPISWDKIHDDHHWIAIDWDGTVCSFQLEPKFNNGYWIDQKDSLLEFIECLEYLIHHPSECLWKRPKTQNE